MIRRWPPMKQSALRALGQAELEYLEGLGWVSSIGLDGLWNSHTIGFLVQFNYAVISRKDGTRMARITPAGRAALADEDWRAA